MKSGYSRETISANISELMHAGMEEKRAIATAIAAARVAWFKRHPHGWLPYGLQNPKGRGNREDYTEQGAPLMRQNPVEMKRAARLQKAFNGSVGRTEHVQIKALPRAAVVIGPLVMVTYQSARDGGPALYQHTFAPHARPLLAASHDGQQLLIVGGRFRFTERGIVDSRKTRKGK